MAVLELYLKVKLFFIFMGLGVVVGVVLFFAFIYLKNSLKERKEKKLWRKKQELKKNKKA